MTYQYATHLADPTSRAGVRCGQGAARNRTIHIEEVTCKMCKNLMEKGMNS